MSSKDEDEIERMRDEGFALLQDVMKTIDKHDPKNKDVLMVTAFIACKSALGAGIDFNKFMAIMGAAFLKYEGMEQKERDDEDDGFFTFNRRNR